MSDNYTTIEIGTVCFIRANLANYITYYNYINYTHPHSPKIIAIIRSYRNMHTN